MNVLHVVSTYSDDGTSGGVITVAIEQAKGLMAAGHDVTILSGWRGHGTPPASVDGVPARFLRVTPPPGIGERAHVGGTIYLEMFRQLKAADIAHIHLCRDFITTAAAGIARAVGTPYVTQTHGMITDPVTTRRKLMNSLAMPALRGAVTRICLFPDELTLMERLVPRGRAVLIPNAVSPSFRRPRQPQPLVLFLGRMQRRKRPDHFVNSAQSLHHKYPDVQFELIGPDEGAAAEIVRQIATSPDVPIAWRGAIPREQAANRLAEASIYVLPSIDEPFPMSLVEALAIGVPSISTTSCGLAGMISEANAGVVVEPTQQALTDAIDELLSSPSRRTLLSENAIALSDGRLSLASVIGQLVAEYELGIQGGTA